MMIMMNAHTFRRRFKVSPNRAAHGQAFRPVLRSFGAALMLAAALLAAGCEESVDPIIGSEYPFTLWGFMNSGADTQYVRVFPITGDIGFDTTSVIDARVFSTDLTSGEQREWTYKKVGFDSLGSGHVFWSPFRAEFEHRYRLEVSRSDGAASSVEVTVPPEVEIEVDVYLQGVSIPIRIEGDTPNLVGPKVTYHAINVPPSNAWPPWTPIFPPVLHSVTVPYDDELRTTTDGWRLMVNMVNDTAAVFGDFRANCLITSRRFSAPNVWLRSMEFSVVAADSMWRPPGGVFDPNVLAVPGTMSNVENGYGFFGAGQGIRYEWEPAPEAREQAGYSFANRCQRMPSDTDMCRHPPIPCIGENYEDVWTLWLR